MQKNIDAFFRKHSGFKLDTLTHILILFDKYQKTRKYLEMFANYHVFLYEYFVI